MIRYLILVPALAGLLVGCASSTTAPSESVPVETLQAPLQASRVALTVHGLSCPLCAENVGKTLRQVEGVASVDRDLSRGLWTVTFAPDHAVTRADLDRAIARAGFTLVAVEEVKP